MCYFSKSLWIFAVVSSALSEETKQIAPDVHRNTTSSTGALLQPPLPTSLDPNTQIIVVISVAAALLGIASVIFLARYAREHVVEDNVQPSAESFGCIEAWLQTSGMSPGYEIDRVGANHCAAPLVISSPSIARTVQYTTDLEIVSSHGTIITASERIPARGCETWFSNSTEDEDHDAPTLPHIGGLEPLWEIDWSQFARRTD